MTSNQQAAEAWSYYSKDFNLICEFAGQVTTLNNGLHTLFQFTHQPSEEVYNVLAVNCKLARKLLIDKYYGLPHNPIPVYGD